MCHAWPPCAFLCLFSRLGTTDVVFQRNTGSIELAIEYMKGMFGARSIYATPWFQLPQVAQCIPKSKVCELINGKYIFLIIRAQKDGSADRSWFCELYDGEATVGVKASNDVKRVSVEVCTYALSIGGFHQPQPFLMEQSDFRLRKDGFMERFLIACPFPKRMLCAEVASANENLKENYAECNHSFKKLLDLIYKYHNAESRQYR